MATRTREELQAEYERLRAVMIEILSRAAAVAPGDSGAAWRALGGIEELARHVLEPWQPERTAGNVEITD
jgi:hypothetical protein